MISKKVLDQAKNFPKQSGVYIMRDKEYKIIYIGKAKSLKNRINNYFSGQDKRVTVEFLVNKVASLDYIITSNEEEALLLERELIREHKPKYNIMLKDDKAYISIRIDINKDFPKIETVRKIQNDGALYFGPFSQGFKLKQVLELIKEIIPLRTCSDASFKNRVRPCLEYQIKRCLAPCKNLISKEEYKEYLSQAIKIIEGKTSEVLKELKEKMNECSKNLLFENAMALRDKISILEDYKKNIHVHSHRAELKDYFSFYRDNNYVSLCVMSTQGTKIINTRNFKLENVSLSDEELLENTVLDYYENISGLPEELIVSIECENYDFIKKVIKKLYGVSVEITNPKKGEKFRILNLAKINAKKAYEKFFEQDEIYREIAKELKAKFNLRKFPKQVECVDISNLQSSDIVGGIVVFKNGVPKKNLYKRYIVKNESQNDFESIYEVVYRRLKRGIEESDLPDLLVIDGGDKQLVKAIEARDELKLNIDIVALAKFRTSHLKPERVFLEGQDEPIELSMHDNLSFFMQRVRDAAHENVITYHRERREKRAQHSILDDIKGIGPERKKKLLLHFKTIENIKNADVNEIADVLRVPEKKALEFKEGICNILK